MRRRNNETAAEALERERARYENGAVRLRTKAAVLEQKAADEAKQRLRKSHREAERLELEALEHDRQAEIARRQAAYLAEADALSVEMTAQDAATRGARDRHAVTMVRAAELSGKLQQTKQQLGARQAEVEQLTDCGRLDAAATLELELAQEHAAIEAIDAELGRARAEAEHLSGVVRVAEAMAASMRKRVVELRAAARRAREQVLDEERQAEEKRQRDLERGTAAATLRAAGSNRRDWRIRAGARGCAGP